MLEVASSGVETLRTLIAMGYSKSQKMSLNVAVRAPTNI